MTTITAPKKVNFKFTGGDKLTGLYQLYHKVMMLNELKDGYGAYEVRYAGGNSGISFGGNQMDMGANVERAEFFVDILKQAVNDSGKYIFTEEEIKVISGVYNENLIQIQKSPESIFGDYLPRVNAALSSEYGRAQIDAIYPIEIKNKSEHIEKVIKYIKNPAAQKFYDSDKGRVLLFDYHNQFNLKLDETFIEEYIDGKINHKKRTHYQTKNPISAPIDTYAIEQHLEYIRSTKEYTDRPQGCERRVNNILAVLKEINDAKIIKALAETYTQHFGFKFDKKQNRWKIYPDLEMPEIPTPQGRQSFFFNTVVANYFFLPPYPKDPVFKLNFFYYHADTKRLFYVQGQDLDFVLPHSKIGDPDDWGILSIGLSPIVPKLFMELPEQINTQNYVVYMIKMKNEPVHGKDLMRWLGNAIIAESQETTA